jgi:hypothetical protein
MDEPAFKSHVAESVEASVAAAESKLGIALPRRYTFQWFGSDQYPRVPHDEVVDEISRRVFVDPDHIYPCVDLGPIEVLPDGTLLLIGKRAGFAPAKFQKNWTGRDGPFVLFHGPRLLEASSNNRWNGP